MENMEETPLQTMCLLLQDWFETIEEIELTEDDRVMLISVAEVLSTAKSLAMTLGIMPEDFDEWLQLEVLETWTYLVEDSEMAAEKPVLTFTQFVLEGEQRLYLQMLKRCMPITQNVVPA